MIWERKILKMTITYLGWRKPGQDGTHQNVPSGEYVLKRLKLIEYPIYLKILREHFNSWERGVGAELMIGT